MPIKFAELNNLTKKTSNTSEPSSDKPKSSPEPIQPKGSSAGSHASNSSSKSILTWTTYMALTILAGIALYVGLSLRKRFIVQLRP